MKKTLVCVSVICVCVSCVCFEDCSVCNFTEIDRVHGLKSHQKWSLRINILGGMPPNPPSLACFARLPALALLLPEILGRTLQSGLSILFQEFRYSRLSRVQVQQAPLDILRVYMNFVPAQQTTCMAREA